MRLNQESKRTIIENMTNNEKSAIMQAVGITFPNKTCSRLYLKAIRSLK